MDIGGIDGIDGMDDIGGICGVCSVWGMGGRCGFGLRLGILLGMGFDSLISTTTASDNRKVFATDAACSKQHLTTCPSLDSSFNMSITIHINITSALVF